MAAILSRPQCVNFEVDAALADHLELFGPANIYWCNGHLVCMLCVFTETAFKGRYSLQWRHNERDGVSSPRRLDCLLKRLFKENIKAPRQWLCAGIHRWPGIPLIKDQ